MGLLVGKLILEGLAGELPRSITRGAEFKANISLTQGCLEVLSEKPPTETGDRCYCYDCVPARGWNGHKCPRWCFQRLADARIAHIDFLKSIHTNLKRRHRQKPRNNITYISWFSRCMR